jgi:hypothetical protein
VLAHLEGDAALDEAAVVVDLDLIERLWIEVDVDAAARELGADLVAAPTALASSRTGHPVSPGGIQGGEFRTTPLSAGRGS